jgi:hypothetical protein
MDKVNDILDKARELLKGEPLRAIGYGAGVIIYIVAKALGNVEDIPLDQAIVQAGLAAATLASVIETARRFVYSPATVEVIAERSAETGVPQVPAPPADNLK